MTKYQTLVEWFDPANIRHPVGEVAELDPVIVFDIPDLVKQYTIFEVLPDVLPLASDSPQGELPVAPVEISPIGENAPPTPVTEAAPTVAAEGVG
jgi:hypothetical protein